MAFPTEVKVTTEVLWRATLIFAPIDAVFLSILAWRIDEGVFKSLKRTLIVTTAAMGPAALARSAILVRTQPERLARTAQPERFIPPE